MAAVEQHLIRPRDGLILLLTPPFDRSTLDPGYIGAYLPGVRENGGQYTHAAAWAVLAFAALGIECEVDHHDRVLLYDADQQDHSDQRDEREIVTQAHQCEERAHPRGRKG